MAPAHNFQIPLRVTVQNQIRIAQRVIVDEVVQFRPLRHGHVQFILDPGAVDGNVKQKRQWTACLPVDIPTGWEPQRNLAVRALRVAFADFSKPLGRALKNQNAAPTTPPCFSRWLRSSSLLFKSSSAPKKKNQYTLCTGFSWCRNAIQIRTISL